MSNENIEQSDFNNFVEEEEGEAAGGDEFIVGPAENDNTYYDDDNPVVNPVDGEQEQGEIRYSTAGYEQGDDQYFDNDGQYYDDGQQHYDGGGGDDGQSGAEFSSFDQAARSSNGAFWSDDWPFPYDDDDYVEGDEDLYLESGDLEGDEDTIANNKVSGESSGVLLTEPRKSSMEKSSSSKRKKKKSKPVELGKKSFRWFEQKLLAQQIESSEENLQRKHLLEKCQMVRKVSKPVVTLMETKPNRVFGPTDSEKLASGSMQSVHSIEDDGEAMHGSEEEEDEIIPEPSRTFRDFTEREWAVKNTVDFLTTQGCESSSSRSYKSSLKIAKEEADFRWTVYEHQLKRRRKAIGNEKGAPEITAALRRHAERAVWRAVMDNTKPRYPIPRFILPRHRYLKKVQSQFIGPGSYELFVFEESTKGRRMRMPSTWATCTARFPKDENESGSGSGRGGATSGRVLLDPWTTLDAANERHKHPGTCIPFESTPQNFRKGLMEGGSRVPPNAYNIKSPLEEYIKKQTSTRGPYDCYTPSRGVIPYGYHKSPNDEEKGRLGPGSYEIRTSLVKEMNDSYNFFKGTFGKADREKMFGFKAAFDNPLWPRDNGTMPAVGQYDPDTNFIGRDHEQNMAPFLVQAGLKQREVKKPDLVAPDYYYYGPGATWTVAPRGAALASVFRSKTPQIMPPKMHHVLKERNKSSNKKLDLDGLAQGFHLEEHYAYDTPVKNEYVLEDCADPCLMPKGGPRVDPYAIPAGGVAANCCGGTGERIVTEKIRGGCCGC